MMFLNRTKIIKLTKNLLFKPRSFSSSSKHSKYVLMFGTLGLCAAGTYAIKMNDEKKTKDMSKQEQEYDAIIESHKTHFIKDQIPITKENPILEQIKVKYEKYIKDPMYVYTFMKSEDDSHSYYLIIARIRYDTMTNEDRNVYDKKNATYQANKLDIVAIIDTQTGNSLESFKINDVQCCEAHPYCLSHGKNIVQFIVGEQIPHMRTDHPTYKNSKIYNNSETIKYFKSIETAFYCCHSKANYCYSYNYVEDEACEDREDETDICDKCIKVIYPFDNFTGILIDYRIDGQKLMQREFDNGRMIRQKIWWDISDKSKNKHKNKQSIKEDFIHILDTDTRYLTCWYKNGFKESEKKYIGDQKAGPWTYWTPDGKKFNDQHYENGKLIHNIYY